MGNDMEVSKSADAGVEGCGEEQRMYYKTK